MREKNAPNSIRQNHTFGDGKMITKIFIFHQIFALEHDANNSPFFSFTLECTDGKLHLFRLARFGEIIQWRRQKENAIAFGTDFVFYTRNESLTRRALQ